MIFATDNIPLNRIEFPLVSIGVPTLNSERYLSDRIESIKKQRYPNCEIIVVDGGSTDRTLPILRQWQSDDSRVRLIDRPVLGLYRAFNEILNQSRGVYATIQPADDLMPPDFLEVMVDVLEKRPDASVAVSRLRVFDGDGRRIDSDMQASVSERIRPASSNSDSPSLADPIVTGDGWEIHRWPLDGLMGLSRRNPFVSQTQLVLRRDAVNESRFETDLGSTADILMNIRLGLNHDIVHVNRTWSGWRIHAEQASQLVHDETLKRERLEWMISTAMKEFRWKSGASQISGQVEQLTKRCAELQQLRLRMSEPSRPSRYRSLLEAIFRTPTAARLHLSDRIFGSNQSLAWIQNNAINITHQRLSATITNTED